ncbi:hypothetical protein ACGFIV_23270 [Sphaerisporangium sp. NPDC049003]|uniref:hypothetical protein n=1 Tax=Sphaerisporangium sp. NPDC049003 TaxID=3364517 RepID=UPI00371CF7F0
MPEEHGPTISRSPEPVAESRLLVIVKLVPTGRGDPFRMNPLKSLFRVVAGAVLAMPLVATASVASASSVEAAPYVRVIINSITIWRTQESGGDHIFVKVGGPSLVPPLNTTYRVWPRTDWSVSSVESGYCMSFLYSPCPSGVRVYNMRDEAPYQPVFRSTGRITVNIREDDPILSDDDLLLESFPISPATGDATYMFRPNAASQSGPDYQIDLKVVPSTTPF